MIERLDPARLEAYADSELDAQAMSETAEQLLRDPEALARVRALHEEAALLRAAYQEAAEAPIPPEILATIDRGGAAAALSSAMPWRRPSASPWSPALSATWPANTARARR
jgi:anti-sigma factor RsiW